MYSFEWMENLFLDFERVVKAFNFVVWRYIYEYNKLDVFFVVVLVRMLGFYIFVVFGVLFFFSSISYFFLF